MDEIEYKSDLSIEKFGNKEEKIIVESIKIHKYRDSFCIPIWDKNLKIKSQNEAFFPINFLFFKKSDKKIKRVDNNWRKKSNIKLNFKPIRSIKTIIVNNNTKKEKINKVFSNNFIENNLTTIRESCIKIRKKLEEDKIKFLDSPNKSRISIVNRINSDIKQIFSTVKYKFIK